MQIINVSEVHRIGGLCPICVVAKGQIKPHSRRTRVGTVVGSEKWKAARSCACPGTGMMCRTFRCAAHLEWHLTTSWDIYPDPARDFKKWLLSNPHKCITALCILEKENSVTIQIAQKKWYKNNNSVNNLEKPPTWDYTFPSRVHVMWRLEMHFLTTQTEKKGSYIM